MDDASLRNSTSQSLASQSELRCLNDPKGTIRAKPDNEQNKPKSRQRAAQLNTGMSASALTAENKCSIDPEGTDGTHSLETADLFKVDRLNGGICPSRSAQIDMKSCTNTAERFYLTKREAAEFLRVSERTLCHWMARGLVSFTRIGRTLRFKRSALESLG